LAKGGSFGIRPLFYDFISYPNPPIKKTRDSYR